MCSKVQSSCLHPSIRHISLPHSSIHCIESFGSSYATSGPRVSVSCGNSSRLFHLSVFSNILRLSFTWICHCARCCRRLNVLPKSAYPSTLSEYHRQRLALLADGRP